MAGAGGVGLLALGPAAVGVAGAADRPAEGVAVFGAELVVVTGVAGAGRDGEPEDGLPPLVGEDALPVEGVATFARLSLEVVLGGVSVAASAGGPA